MHHKIANKLYTKAGEQFEAVVKIIGYEQGASVVQGTGTLIVDEKTQKIALITASHLFEDQEKRLRRYYAQIGKDLYEIEKTHHFADFIIKNYQNHNLIGLEIPQRRLVLSTKLQANPPEDIKKSLTTSGADLALCFLKNPLPPLKAYKITSTENAFLNKSSPLWAVGFGETGRGGHVFSLRQNLWASGPRRAFQANVKPEISLTILNFRKNISERLFTLSSTFEEKGFEHQLIGQVGSGDSGGPLLKKNEATGVYEVYGIISANLPFMETEQFKDQYPKTSRFFELFGGLFGKKSLLSNYLWKEANIYGSQGFYMDVTNTLVQKWIRFVFDSSLSSVL